MCNINWIDEDLKYIWHPCSQMKDYEELKPIVIDHGKGSYLYDINGKELYRQEQLIRNNIKLQAKYQ